eukprot:31522-Pelagococcus_subviridis.AAC.1
MSSPPHGRFSAHNPWTSPSISRHPGRSAIASPADAPSIAATAAASFGSLYPRRLSETWAVPYEAMSGWS